MFVDEVSVKLRAGDGGHGCVSFRREKFVPKGGPDGGDGGDGGDVILVCDRNVSDLRQYYYKPHDAADNGRPGKGANRNGKRGKHCRVKVPPGTVATNEETGAVVGEVLEHEQQIVLLKGGKGGLGNTHFKSSTNQVPRQTTPAGEGERAVFHLELKMIADAGLVGFPNAGKSTLIGLFTNQQPKVAHYPFTTLRPNLGIIEYDDRYDRLTIADIPGLIAGAHENRGLGHQFLRHIERCALLLLLIDLAGEDGRDPVEDWHTLRDELAAYSPALVEKPMLIVGNKMDEPAAAENLPRLRAAADREVVPISCLAETGLHELKETLYQRIRHP